VDSIDTLIARSPPRPRIVDARPHAEDGRTGAGCSVLGRYRLLERLGAGGFGVVWRAHDGLLDREVAVKIIPLPPGEDEDRERATREAHAAARLAHPAIVALYEACVEGDAFYLISELVHGTTLAESLAARALCDEEVLEIGAALADALLHAHERGVIHRDLKPHNVLVPLAAPLEPDDRDDSGSRGAWTQRRRGDGLEPHDAGGAPSHSGSPAKLTDFGGAQLTGEDALTRTGNVLGTLAYMAPEQIEGHDVDGQADLYSLALVLYEALTGVNPVRGPTPAATVRRIGRELEPMERSRRDLPRGLTRALDRALDPVPCERGTLWELRDALSEALARGLSRSPRRRHASTSATALHRPAQAGPGPAPSQLPPPYLPPATAEDAQRGGSTEHSRVRDDGDWLTLPRVVWLGGSVAICTWLLASGRSGAALLVLCAVAPLLLLVRRPGVRWLTAALAPVLGLAGLAGAFPALAGQAARWRSRALLGALGYWWLCLAALPLDGRTIASLPGLALLCGVALWALAAVLLPWVVRGRSAPADVLAAVLWAAALTVCWWVGLPSLVRGLPFAHAGGPGLHPAPPAQSAILGAALAGALAVAARALRGRVG
jgi:serine/threonine protein kinase